MGLQIMGSHVWFFKSKSDLKTVLEFSSRCICFGEIHVSQKILLVYGPGIWLIKPWRQIIIHGGSSYDKGMIYILLFLWLKNKC